MCLELDDGPGSDSSGPDAAVGDAEVIVDAGFDAVVPTSEVRDSGSSPNQPAEGAPQSPSVAPLASTCSLAGHCAAWPMPDLHGKFAPALLRDDDQIVRDLVTGLVWEAKVNFGGPLLAAEEYCANLSLAGQSDWRIPTLIELMSIYGSVSTSPALDTIAFPDELLDRTVWAARARIGDEEFVYTVYTGGTGSVLRWYSAAAPSPNDVRCVRAGKLSTGSRYSVDDNEGVVVDNWTKLIWKRHEEAGALSFDDATARCAGAGPAWRLPTAKELVTLVDPVAMEVSIDVSAFPGTTPGQFWSSTQVTRRNERGVQTYRRVVGFGANPRGGNISMPNRPVDDPSPLHVRCVR